MKKKLLMVLMVGMVSAFALAGCGGSGEEAADAPAATESTKEENQTEEPAVKETEAEEPEAEETQEAAADEADEADSTSSSGDWSLLDVSEDMIEVGVYGSDEDGTELVFSMFTGPDGEKYVSLFGFDNNSNSGDVICGTYEASTETDDEGDNWTYFNVTDVYTGGTFQLGVAERPSTEEVLFFDKEGNVVEGSYLSAEETINYMGSAAALLSSDSSSEDSEDGDDIIAQLKQVLTLGYAGGSAADEEIYFACDENVDKGILGIVNDGDATFLAGDITEDEDGVLTITDSQSGNTLSFTTESTTDDEGNDCVVLTVVSNQSVGVIYPVDASDVIDEMSKY